ncbi:alpha-2,8-sialyltransferase 8E-like [Theristicus caerulescens]
MKKVSGSGAKAVEEYQWNHCPGIAFSKIPNSISREKSVKPGLLKVHKLWVMLLAVAAVSFVSMCFLVLNDSLSPLLFCYSPPSSHPQTSAYCLRLSPPYRAELGRCCNASAWLAVTQDNTLLGSEIVYDGYHSKSLKVSSGLLEILPEKSPFWDPLYKTCAVVGNGGILRNSSCGSKIDKHEFVIRFNLPSVDFSEDVGRKSSIVTVNPSILQKWFRGLNGRRLPFVKADSASQSRVFFFHPQYLSALSKYWHDRGFHTHHLSSGFMLVNAALELCQHITLYGFWPFSLHPDGHSLPHHYYDNVLPNLRVHTMPREFTYYVDMHFHGVLQLHLGWC